MVLNFGDISAKEAHDMIEKNEGNEKFIILDVRTPPEVAMGRIEGAKSVNVASPFFMEEIKKYGANNTYLVYCRSGARSGHAVHMMQHAGVKEAYNLEGGVMSWEDEGFELVK